MNLLAISKDLLSGHATVPRPRPIVVAIAVLECGALVGTRTMPKSADLFLKGMRYELLPAATERASNKRPSDIEIRRAAGRLALGL